MTALATGPSSMPSLDSRFRGNDTALQLFAVMPALRLRSGQAPAGIQDLLLLRVNADESRSSSCPQDRLRYSARSESRRCGGSIRQRSARPAAIVLLISSAMVR